MHDHAGRAGIDVGLFIDEDQLGLGIVERQDLDDDLFVNQSRRRRFRRIGTDLDIDLVEDLGLTAARPAA